MSPSVTKLLDLIETGAVSAQNASEAIRQAGGTSLCLLEAVRALGAGDGGGGSVSLTPGIAYVEASGDDETGTLGDPGRPFATGTGAWAAGQATEQMFSIRFGAGAHTINCGGEGTGWLVGLIGCGFGASHEGSICRVAINANAVAVVEGEAGSGGDVNLCVYNLSLDVTAFGGGVEPGNVGTGGNAGNVTLRGHASISVDARGGGPGEGGSGGGGNGSVITLSGSLASRGILTAGGDGVGGGSSGQPGELIADGCDLRGYVLAGTITLGRCSYTSGLSINNDRGGNSAYP